ncbi:MAG: hypothetical protein J5992_08550 [Oscillospiraceae bacterium]|nr:hypothetical protein [Oscillospiraceae bacterium]
MNKFKEKPLQILVATGLEPLPVDFDSKADYDNDGLLNTKEIDWNSPLIKDKSLKTYESLPTVQECIGYTKELTYVENGLKRLQTLPGNVYSELITKRILPINSDPLSVDGEDGLIPLEDEIFLLNIRNNPLIFVNIEESDTDMRNIVVEYFYRETAEYQKICYVYDSEKEKYRKF